MRATSQPSTHAALERPGRSLLCCATWLAAGFAVTQWGGFVQPVLAGGDRITQQYESFREHVARDGPHDLVIFGNSAARQGIDATDLESLLTECSGEPLLAYNFAAGGTTTPLLPFSADLVYGVDAPPMALVVLTPPMVSSWSADRQSKLDLVRDSPVGRALHDPLRWRGALSRWALEHLAVCGLRYRARAWLTGAPHPSREPGGYGPRKGSESWPPQEEVRYEQQRARDREGDWSQGPVKEAQLAAAVRHLQSLGARVWLVEAPVHPERAATLAELGVPADTLPAALRRLASATGARPLLVPPELELDADDFIDLLHLRNDGARRYTAWLADQVCADLLERTSPGPR